MTNDPTPENGGSNATRRDESVTAAVTDVANRFAETYASTRTDPDFAELFADDVEIWHNFDDATMVLRGDDFAAAMLRMLEATAEVVHEHSDRIWSLEIGEHGFALAATATGELDGNPVRIARCLLVSVEAGRITRISEFGDRQQRAPLDEALRAAGRFRS